MANHDTLRGWGDRAKVAWFVDNAERNSAPARAARTAGGINVVALLATSELCKLLMWTGDIDRGKRGPAMQSACVASP